MLDLLALLAHKSTNIDADASSMLDLAAGGKGELDGAMRTCAKSKKKN